MDRDVTSAWTAWDLFQQDMVDVNTVSPAGTPLGGAAKHGHIEVVEALLKTPTIDVNARDAGGDTALHRCLQERPSANGLACIRRLLAAPGIDVNAVNLANGRTPLIEAARSGAVETIKLLIKIPAIDLNHRDGAGRTALESALERGHPDIVRLLLAASGIEVDWRALLSLAVYHNDCAMARWLLGNASSPIEITKQLVESAIESSDDTRGSDMVVILLAALPRHISWPDASWTELLNLAARSGKLTTMRLLLSAGARASESTMLLAARNSSPAALELLQRVTGLDPNQPDALGQTPLMAACMGGCDEMLGYLIGRSDVNVNAADIHGRTALHEIIRCCPESPRYSRAGYHICFHRLLASPKIDVNRVDEDGNSALHFAALQGDPYLIEKLLAVPGIVVSAGNREGLTPLRIAEARCKIDEDEGEPEHWRRLRRRNATETVRLLNVAGQIA